MNIDKESLPKHIAIIMDGNRRWAKSKGKPATLGHKEGTKTLEKILKHAEKIGIEYVTVYAFSTENWKRSKEEVDTLMGLLKDYLESFSKKKDTKNAKLRILGNIEVLSEDLRNSINNCVERTKNNTGVTCNIAFNYGGRDEILYAVKNIASKVKSGEINENDITEELFSQNLYTKNEPDPDLMIRTSGEIRLSNFLPWQLVYSEFVFVDKNWPDFNEKDLEEAITVYQKRTRKFGAC